jgi:hypothetical protein
VTAVSSAILDLLEELPAKRDRIDVHAVAGGLKSERRLELPRPFEIKE